MPVVTGQRVCQLFFGRSAVQITACNSLEPRTVAATDSRTPWKWWVKPRTPSVYAPRQERVTLPKRGTSLVSTAHPSEYTGFPSLQQAEAEYSWQLHSVPEDWGRQVLRAVFCWPPRTPSPSSFLPSALALRVLIRTDLSTERGRWNWSLLYRVKEKHQYSILTHIYGI